MRMRLVMFIVSFLFVNTLLSQTNKIRIKKQEPLYKVTLAGKDTGTVLLSHILDDKRLIIPNNKFKLKIYAYDATVIEDSVISRYEGNSEKLTKEMLDKLSAKDQNLGVQINIKRILAYNEFNETINLNEIQLRVLLEGP